MILYEREQPFSPKVVPLPCFVISSDEVARNREEPPRRLQRREELLTYLETYPLLDRVYVFEEDEVIYTLCKREELRQEQHRKFAESLTEIYRLPRVGARHWDEYDRYAVNLKADEPVPADGFTLYRNGIEVAEHLLSLEHALELARADSVAVLEKMKSETEERLKETENLLTVLQRERSALNDWKDYFDLTEKNDITH